MPVVGRHRLGFSTLGLVLAVSLGCHVTSDTAAPGNDVQGAQGGEATPAEVAQILAASDLPPEIATPLADDPMKVEVHRLSNGMTVYISTDRQKPRFTGWIGVRAGSRMDPAASTGLAHYLEHMLFKGTDEYGTLDPAKEAPHVERIRQLYADLRSTNDAGARAKIFAEIDRETQEIAKYAVPNEFDRMYSALGVEGLNAFTSDEQTVYIGDVPANRLEAWATVEAERFSDPVFRLFYPELEAVYEEKNLSLDRPFSRVFEELSLALYPQHPYGTQTTIGSVEHLKTPAYQDMVDYFHRWYLPNNMAIALAGDIDAQTALPILEASFGRLQPKSLAKPEPGALPPLRGRVAKSVKADGEESVILAWHTVPSASVDEPALAVMDRLLDDQRVGLLNVELELTQKIPEASSFSRTQNEAGFFAVTGRLRTGQSHTEVEQLLQGVLAKLKNGDFSDADVEAAKLQERVSETTQLEFPFIRAAKMMQSFVGHRPWSDVVERDKRFQRVTRADIIRVANKYLGSDLVALYKVKGKTDVPKLNKPTITPVPIDSSRKSAFFKKIEAMETPQLEPQWLVEGEHYVHRKIPSGTLIAAKNGRNDLFSLTYRVKRGERKERLLCHALELLPLAGSGKTSAEDVQKQLYALGASLSTDCDADTSEIELTGPDAKMDEALAIVNAWLADPTFDDDTVKRLYENTLSIRRDTFEEDRALTRALDDFAKYGRQSPWLAQPTNVQLAKASRARLRKLISGALGYRHDVLYFGPRAPEAVAAAVARKGRFRPTLAVPPRKFRKLRSEQVYFLHKDGAKANVRFVIPRGPLPREERPAAKLFSEYLSGNMSALVFQEIREARGLAYTANSRFSWGERPRDDSGLFGFMSTQADKTPLATETFLGLIRAETIQGERLTATQSAVDQEYRASRIDPRFVTEWVYAWDELGEPTDPRPWEREQVAALTVDDVAAFAKGLIGTPVIVGVVGDRARVNLPELKRIGQIVEVEPAAVLGYGPFPPGTGPDAYTRDEKGTKEPKKPAPQIKVTPEGGQGGAGSP